MAPTNRRRRRSLSAMAMLLVAFASLRAEAVTLSVDVDPGTVGIQASRTLSSGDSFVVDIVIGDVDFSAPLTGFEFDLDFDAGLLAATSVVSGNFLPPSFFGPALTVESDVTGSDVNFAEAAIGSPGATGSGVLAQIAFDAIADGVSALVLNDVLLSSGFGVPIFGSSFNNAAVTSQGPIIAVPEPASVVLVLTGLLALRTFKIAALTKHMS